MGDNKEFYDSAIFWGILLMVGLWKLQNIEDASLVDVGYQMLRPFSLAWDRILIVHTSHQSEILHYFFLEISHEDLHIHRVKRQSEPCTKGSV